MAENAEKFGLTESAKKRILHLQEMEKNSSGMENPILRIMVYSGGCAGFKYHLEMTNQVEEGDVVIASDGVNLAVLDIDTLEMLNGGTLDFVDEISGSYFRIKNPNAKQSCGCGNSFA
ncbi:HesB/IscA family protein [Candidatus Deianiraea vastatrix]|uniref:Iron-sulfur cluster insertion protein ErpA n=1 Tax=Candidatus Deianiraea vastatrix TaxID=2163644 RepID=A0A5B8XDA3_9RICK|nr:iron-sulfur cluster assembly accessory protein [Candidatus Deianiraea vastatrix]QED23349.1 Iron-sulfur cluster insertion protein ErpA [Candidatus Deianiraea vastatrix]